MSHPKDRPTPSDSTPSWDLRFATFLYKWRWPSTLLAGVLVIAAFAVGGQRIASFTNSIASLGDNSDGSGKLQPLVFDPSLDIWFGEQDEAVQTYYEIEDRFVAEDFLLVTFENKEHELGVFSPESLATIQRLTERFLTIPGVRHVRSLTYNPWIRWGEITDDLGSEAGLIISDLVEGEASELDDRDIVTRMVAVLGAERVAQRLGEDRVRTVIGEAASFVDHIGEPLLLDTIVDQGGTTTAIQVQVLRPRIEQQALDTAFDALPGTNTDAAAKLYSALYQRAALRGVRHFLHLERGLAQPTEAFVSLQQQVESWPDGESKDARLLELNDPTRNFVPDDQGQPMAKYHYFRLAADGSIETGNGEPAVDLAQLQPLSDFNYHLGGVPVFELNFEEVGMRDARFLPLMFTVIAFCLIFVFRHAVGVVAPFAVVFGSIMAMVGFAFAVGDLFNNLTMMAPNMLTAVGIADAVHLVAAWAALRPLYRNRRDLVIEVMRRNALPVLLTSITTAVGFYSLTVSALAPVTMLGYTAGLGALIAYALSMTVVPALLSMVKTPAEAAGEDEDQDTRQPSRLAQIFSIQRSQRFMAQILALRVPILAAALLMLVVSLYGLTKVEIDTDFRSMFPDSNPTMTDFNWIEDRMGGVGDLEIVFAGLTAPAVEPGEPAQATSKVGPLALEQEQRLSELRLRQAGVQQEPDSFQALDADEQRELQQLTQLETAWNAARIGVSPEFLGELDAFENRLRQEMADPESPLRFLTDLISPLDILRKMNQVQNENRAAWYRVPQEADVPSELRQATLSFDPWSDSWSLVPAQQGASLVAQYYLQYENGARPGENLSTQLSNDRRQLRMQGRVLQGSSADHRAAFARLREIAREEFPRLAANELNREASSLTAESSHALETDSAQGAGSTALSELTLSGKSLLFAQSVHLFSVGFVKSMGLALLIITVLIGLIFRSPSLAMLSLLPNVLPILLPLSMFGLLGLPLQGPAILVSTVALGVCVDDTIHFLTKYVRLRRQGQAVPTALAEVMTQVGPALSITTVVLVIGFSTLLLSDFTPNILMGALATVMIALAWVADFVLTPAVLSFVDQRKPSTDSELGFDAEPTLAS